MKRSAATRAAIVVGVALALSACESYEWKRASVVGEVYGGAQVNNSMDGWKCHVVIRLRSGRKLKFDHPLGRCMELTRDGERVAVIQTWRQSADGRRFNEQWELP